ncbi:MAG TPA: DUF72 domain-containing protein [Blastocatellia bacterium]|nr:DUF72 domain-containing protein [Blastocatellia bacterium]
MVAIVRVGMAGWAYDDWKGVVYPRDSNSKFDRLGYMARYFDTVEINTSFYAPPSDKSTKEWLKRVEYNRLFKFTAKLYQGFTHKPGMGTKEDEFKFKQSMEPLIDAGRLGAVVAQFPWSFQRSPENRKYVDALLERFKDFPLVLEVKHSSWNEQPVYESLEKRSVGFCNIDQPLFAGSLEPSSFITSQIGYIRMHGRNSRSWFQVQPGDCCKHDYFYSEEELKPWIERIRKMKDSANEIYVLMINTCKGQGMANALQIRAALENRRVKVPDLLLSAFPQLKKIAESTALEPRLHDVA